MTQAPDPQATLLAEAQEIVAHVRALRRDLLHATTADVGPDIERSGLTGPQISAMTHLVMQGPTTLTELSRAMGISHSTASGIVDRLQARGLVQRTQDSADRRYTRVSVTEQVQRYVEQLGEGPLGRLADALERATPQQRQTIREGLVLLRQLLDPSAG